MNRRSFNKALLAAAAFGMRPQQSQGARINGERLSANMSALAQFGRNDKGGITRVAYSDADLAARQHVSALIRAAGLSVRIDSAANIVGRRNGRENSLPSIKIV